MGDDEGIEEVNIVMFPFMAQGHIIPFLALAHHIERQRRNCSITFVNTPLNIANLRASLPPASSIRLLEIPFSAADHGLPPGTENTDGIPYPLIHRLLRASLSLLPAFRLLVSGLASDPRRRRLCILADMFFPWTAEVAREFGAFNAIYCGGGGFGFACYYSLWLALLNGHKTEESEAGDFELPDFPEAGAIHRSQLSPGLLAAGEDDSWRRFQAKTLPNWGNSDAILFNTVEGIDRIGLDYFRRKINRPVWAIGPILRPLKDESPAGMSPGFCRKWLDAKPPNSVLYVSFGSQNTPSASQMIQLATALEASGRNFIWVLRPPLGFDSNSEFDPRKWLPEGFEERVGAGEENRGLLIHRWAPQLEILSHESISTFLSHGGWNSVLEALSRGVPILGWPMAAEQFYNVKLLVEKLGVCVEVGRGSSCEVGKEDLVRKMELVMGEEAEEGKEMRRKAREVMGMIVDAIRDNEGSSVKAMHEFFETAVSTREETKNN